MIRLCILAFYLSMTTNGFDLDNIVTGRPDVQCGIDTIAVTMNTQKPFKGKMYVQGESEADGCLKSLPDSIDVLRFELPIGSCNMRRQRTLQPRGVAFSFTLVVSFHPLFVTGLDRAFNVRCFFLESVKALNTEVDVSQLTTEILEQEFPLPQCIYEIREGVDGPSLKFAHVGQKVTHRWYCDSAVNWVYGMLIHSCFADDGRGNKFELVDEHGCSTEPSLLPQIQYDNGNAIAFTHSNIFKYADKIQLYFTCTVQLCYKHDGGCEGVTPPACGAEPVLLSGPVVPPHPIITGGLLFPLEKPYLKPVSNKESQSLPILKIPEFVPPEVTERIRQLIGHPEEKYDMEQIPAEKEKTETILPGPPPPGDGPFRLRPPFRRRSYKDSPLNLTDVGEEEWKQTLAPSTTVEVSTADASRTTKTLWPFTEKPTTATLRVFANGEDGSPHQKTIKRQRDLKKIETDLGVDVIVLPPQAEGNMKANEISDSFTSAAICVSRSASLAVLSCMLIILLVITGLTFIFARKNRRSAQKSHPMMDAFH